MTEIPSKERNGIEEEKVYAYMQHIQEIYIGGGVTNGSGCSGWMKLW